jgi:hypothetical protein
MPWHWCCHSDQKKQYLSIIQDNNKSESQIPLGKWDFQNPIKIDSDFGCKVSIIV